MYNLYIFGNGDHKYSYYFGYQIPESRSSTKRKNISIIMKPNERKLSVKKLKPKTKRTKKVHLLNLYLIQVKALM